MHPSFVTWNWMVQPSTDTSWIRAGFSVWILRIPYFFDSIIYVTSKRIIKQEGFEMFWTIDMFMLPNGPSTKITSTLRISHSQRKIVSQPLVSGRVVMFVLLAWLWKMTIVQWLNHVITDIYIYIYIHTGNYCAGQLFGMVLESGCAGQLFGMVLESGEHNQK